MLYIHNNMYYKHSEMQHRLNTWVLTEIRAKVWYKSFFAYIECILYIHFTYSVSLMSLHEWYMCFLRWIQIGAWFRPHSILGNASLTMHFKFIDHSKLQNGRYTHFNDLWHSLSGKFYLSNNAFYCSSNYCLIIIRNCSKNMKILRNYNDFCDVDRLLFTTCFFWHMRNNFAVSRLWAKCHAVIRYVASHFKQSLYSLAMQRRIVCR